MKEPGATREDSSNAVEDFMFNQVSPRKIVVGAFLAVGVFVVGCGGSTTTGVGGDPTDGGLADGAVLDGGSPAEAGPGGTTAGIPCGSVSCPTTGAICCAYATSGSATGYSYLCVGGATCPVGDAGGGAQTPTVLSCTGAANCATGTICCVHHNQDNQGAQSSTSTCKASCDAKEAQLCDPKAPASGCPTNAPCSSANIDKWEFPNTFATCGGVAPPQ